MPDLPREDRESLRRLHMDEPVELTNVHAHASASVLSRNEDSWRLGVNEALALAQANATLALAQEVKNLRLAMYGDASDG